MMQPSVCFNCAKRDEVRGAVAVFSPRFVTLVRQRDHALLMLKLK